MSIPTLIRCIGCGLPLGSALEKPSQGALDHVRTCPKHPLAKELKAAKEEIAKLVQSRIDAALERLLRGP